MGNCKSTPSLPSLGFTYKSTDPITNSNLQALAGLMPIAQQQFCKTKGKQIISIINKKDFKDVSGKKASVVISELSGFITSIIDSNEQFGSDEKKLLISTLTNLITVSINNSTTNGIIDSVKFKQNLINMILSICPSAAPTPNEPSISKFGSMTSGTNLYILIAVIAAVGFYFYKKKKSAFGKHRR